MKRARRCLTPVLAMVSIYLTAAACLQDQSLQPLQDGHSEPSFIRSKPPRTSQTLDDEFVELAKRIPGFGGFFFDEDGTANVYLQDVTRVASAKPIITTYLGRDLRSPANIRVRRGTYGFGRLKEWHDRLTVELGDPVVVFTDINEAKNRIVVGVRHRGGFALVRRIASELGVPAKAILIVPAEAAVPTSTLRDRIRPAEGGLQIASATRVCTLGFNAVQTFRIFITASHCTNVQGGDENTVFWQPVDDGPSSDANVLGIEMKDPVYSQGGSCPSGRRCRRSDAAMVAYDSEVDSRPHSVALTTFKGNNGPGSITINSANPHYNIVNEHHLGIQTGLNFHKIGRDNGWTDGAVHQTCININVSGTNIRLTCQYIAAGKTGPGDSGAPVLDPCCETGARIVGIVAGVFSSTEYYFSPIGAIEDELGEFNSCYPESNC